MLNKTRRLLSNGLSVVSLNGSASERVRRKKRIVGSVAIAFIVFFTVLAFIGILNLILWVLGDVAVALAANLVLRRLGSPARS